MIVIFLIVWFILLIIGLPIVFSLGIVSIFYCIIMQIPLSILPLRMVSSLDSFILLAVPLFIFAGRIMNRGGITERIFAFAKSLIGHIPGGLGHVNVLASMIFAGMSGSSIADIGGLGTIEMKAMNDNGYETDFSAGITLASSTIGPIIPPSIPVIIYAQLADVSVVKLFAGGIIPGIIMGISLMGYIYFLSLKGKFPKENKASLKQIYYSFVKAFPSLLSPAIIVGGILLGIMTPTEAACVAVVYSILLSIIYKNFSLKYLIHEGIETAKITGNVIFIFSVANFFAWVLTRERIPQLLASLLLNISSNPSVVIFCIIIIGLIVGCFMEGIASMIILVPVFVPLMNSLHLDLVHMGLVIIITMMLGSLTPPFGAGLFATAQVAEISYERMVKAAIPFLIPLYIALLITAYVPTTVTFLSNLFAR